MSPVQDVSRFEAWILAARPKTLLAAVAPVAVGTGLAEARGVFAAGPALAALVGAILIQIGTNLANDYYDHVRGGDTDDRVGPVRVTQAGILEPGAVKGALWVVFAAGIAYTGGPYPLAYHGLGEVFVFLFFGLVAVAGTYYVQGLELRAELFLAGAGMGAMSSAILVANNLRDLPTDAGAGKRTLAVRVGVPATQLEYALLLALGFLAPVFGVQLFGWTLWSCLALLAGVPAVAPLRRVIARGHDPVALQPALGQTAGVTGLYGVLLAGGLAFG